MSKREVVNNGRRCAMSFQVRLECFWALDVPIRNLQCQILCRVPGDAATVGIEFWLIKIVAIFIRLAPREDAAFNFHISPDQTGGGGPESEMRPILPTVSDRGIRSIHRCRGTKK